VISFRCPAPLWGLTVTKDTDTATDDETQELLELLGMAGLLKLRLESFKTGLTDDLLHDILERAALRYGKGNPAAAAFWLPTLPEQADWLGLFKNNPMAPISTSSSGPSIAISSSRH
jgi:hypothetical protein